MAGKPVLAHHYLRHHLAMLKRLLQAETPTGETSVFWRELVADYARAAQGLSGEAVSDVIHIFRDGRTLVKVGDALSSLNSPANFHRLAGLCLDAPAEFSRWLEGLASKKPADLSREEIQKVLAHFFYYGREGLALDKAQLAFCEALARGNVEALLSSGIPNRARSNGAFWLLQEAVRLNDDRAIDAVLSRAKKIPERETLRDQVQIAWRSARETADREKREKWRRILGALSPVGGNKSW